LFVAQLKNTMVRVLQSIPPCTTSFHLISLWLPSMCHKLFGASTEYVRLRTVSLRRSSIARGSIR